MIDMPKGIKDFLDEKILGRVRLPRWLWYVMPVVLPTVVYILFCQAPYIHIPGNEVSLRMPVFEKCTITFKDNLDFDKYDVEAYVPPEKLSSTTNARPVFNQPLNFRNSTLTITNIMLTEHGITEHGFPAYSVHVFFINVPGCDILKATVDDENINLKYFNKNYIVIQGSRYVKLRYIRNDVAGLIRRFNDTGSNWILTPLFFISVLLIWKLCSMEYRLYIASDTDFKRCLAKFYDESVNASRKADKLAYAKYVDYIVEWSRIFIFLQALGPAVGFILTVSSLIASLDPSTFSGGGTNLDAFLNGIHVALVSTFLGLFLRLIALEAARVNTLLLRRGEMFTNENGFSGVQNASGPGNEEDAP